VALLNAPHVVVSAVRAGPLRRNAQRVEDMLTDRERTLLLPVALAEELPTRETAELVARVRAEVGIPVDRVVVNGVVAPPFPPGLENLDELLARVPADARCGALPPAGVLAACAGFLRARHELNRGYVALVGQLTGLPVVPLPYLVEGLTREPGAPDPLERLGRALLAAEAA
jgi:hypothetical protein